MVLFILGTKTIQVIFGLSLGTKCFLFFFLTCLWDVYPQGMQEKVSVLPHIAHISSWLERFGGSGDQERNVSIREPSPGGIKLKLSI